MLVEPPASGARPRPALYLSIPLQTLAGHTPNDASVGDLDGDGEYEIVLKQEMRGRDNSQAGTTGETKLEAYTLEGRLLWRINLGKNIREGAHYTQFLVYDLDGDGKAEIVCKTADGTIDGQGQPIGDPSADHRNPSGFILKGPEFLTVFDGVTGKALATTDYIPPRGGDGSDWGDNRGNRVDRFLAAVAYLDGARPSVIMCRGYYTRTVLAAWNWREGKLSNVWTFDSDDGTPATEPTAARGTITYASATSTATARMRSFTGPARSTMTAKGCTRRAWATAMPSTSPTSIRTDRAWKSSTSTNALDTPTAPSSATRRPAP